MCEEAVILFRFKENPVLFKGLKHALRWQTLAHTKSALRFCAELRHTCFRQAPPPVSIILA